LNPLTPFAAKVFIGPEDIARVFDTYSIKKHRESLK
jgi:hypothetical protein